MTDRNTFGIDTTTNEVLDGVDLHGTTAVVTGASGGLGAETARAFASKGAEVVLAVRDMAKGVEVAHDIRESTGNDAVEVDELHLDSLFSVRAFAERFTDRHGSLHILVNNAGVMGCPHETTSDGFERQFGTNHVGHFLLTMLLLPALEHGARVVAVSSRSHQLSPVVFDDIHFENRPYDKFSSYGQSKTANILFAVEFEQRYADRGLHAYALHPGVIRTEVSRHLEPDDYKQVRKRATGGRFHIKTVEAGASTAVYAATAPELGDRGGLYLENCQVSGVDDEDNAPTGVRSYAIDPTNAARLWRATEQMVADHR
ncbi:MAG: SDR family NAD(P)-dependent oxidoreductase [Actinomycetota bacterium]